MPKYTAQIELNGRMREIVVEAEHSLEDILRAASQALQVATHAINLRAAWIHRNDGSKEQVH